MKSLGWASSNRTGVLTGKGGEDADTGRGKAVWGHRVDGVYQPRREASQEIKPTNTSITDFQPAHLCKNKSLCLSPLSAVLHEGGSSKWKQSFIWYIFLRPWWKDIQDMSHCWNKGVISWGVTDVWGEGRLVESSVAGGPPFHSLTTSGGTLFLHSWSILIRQSGNQLGSHGWKLHPIMTTSPLPQLSPCQEPRCLLPGPVQPSHWSPSLASSLSSAWPPGDLQVQVQSGCPLIDSPTVVSFADTGSCDSPPLPTPPGAPRPPTLCWL